jgi:hypothetical protein
VNEQESKDIMNQLFDDLDGNEDLVENNMNVQKAIVPVAWNKQEEMTNKYAVAAPTVAESRPAQNMFSKKRLIDEISKPVEVVQTTNDDVEMVEEPVQDIMETENVEPMSSDAK